MRAKLGRSLAALSVAAGVMLAASSSARAQTADFATCGTSPSACSATTQNCCTSNFGTVSGYQPLIIPMDRCHQQYKNGDAPGSGPPDDASNAWCADASPYNTNGMFYAYGLVYRLMQHGIPVYWIVNPTKTASTVTAFASSNHQVYTATDVDFWVLSSGANPPAPTGSLTSCTGACTPPVLRVNSGSTSLPTVAGSYTKQEFPLRGSAFIISGADRASFNAFWNHTSVPLSGRGCGQSGNDCYNFSDVTMYEVQPGSHFAWQDFTTASPYTKHDNEVPVAVKINYAPPKIARLGSTSAVATAWLKAANLDDPASNASCTTGSFSPSDAVFCNVSETDVLSNALVSGAFSWAWLDDFNFSSCTSALAKIKTFMTAVPGSYTAGNVMFNDTSVSATEGCASNQILGASGATSGSLLVGTSAVNETSSNPLLFRYPTNLFLQFGDIPMDFSSSSASSWSTGGARSYGVSSTLKRLVSVDNSQICGDGNGDGDLGSANSPDSGDLPHSLTQVAGCDGSNDLQDMAAYGRYLDDGNNGVAFYMPGNQISNHAAELRMLLNSLLATPNGTVSQVPGTTIEVTRSAPVVATIGGTSAVVQGSYEYVTPVPGVPQILTETDVNTFSFPYVKGHMRAVAANTGLNTSFATATALFDAADHIPSPNWSGCSHYTSGCRTVFTTTASGAAPSLVYLDSSTASTVGSLMAGTLTFSSTANRDLMVQRVLAGYDSGGGVYVPKLGGVDRSTVAVIEQSSIAGSARAQMAYFGADDGMLHAVCVTAGLNGCTTVGQELWAYIPRTNLPFLRFNTARIDGSPRVLDSFGDYDGDGKREWRTILLFQTGSGDASALDRVPAVYALDITKPDAPSVLWEYSMPAVAPSSGTYELGVGLTMAAGSVQINSVNRNIAFAQTNNGGTGGAASVVTAIDMETGAKVWQTGYTYPNPRTSGNDLVPTSGIPGGVVGVDKAQQGYITDLVFNDLYGDMWVLDPETGSSKYGTGPLFSFSSDYHAIGGKPAIYDPGGGTQYAVFVSGGYADPSDSSWPTQCTPAGACAQTGGSAAPVQYVISVSLNTPTAAAPLNESSGSPNIGFKYNLGSGEKGYSQVLVVGNEIFFNTDTVDVNSSTYGTTAGSGHTYALDTSGALQSTTVVDFGASALANSGSALYRGAGSTLNYVGASSSAPGAGTSVDVSQPNAVTRKLWLRTE